MSSNIKFQQNDLVEGGGVINPLARPPDFEASDANVGEIPVVVCNRLSTNRLGTGAPELQAARTRMGQERARLTSSRPGGLSYRQFPIFSPQRGGLSPQR